jgi:ATP-dependent protease ClpP protease subunit
MNMVPKVKQDLTTDFDMFDNEFCRHYVKSVVAHQHSWAIVGEIGDAHYYEDFCQCCYTATDTDQIIIRLNSPGGDCSTGQGIITAIKNCKASVTTMVVAPCYSMASLIALAGDNMVMYQGAFLHFHNYSAAHYGKGREVMDMADNIDKWLGEQQAAICYPFLTKQEIKKLMNDGDVFIHHGDPTLQDRVNRHFSPHKPLKMESLR